MDPVSVLVGVVLGVLSAYSALTARRGVSDLPKTPRDPLEVRIKQVELEWDNTYQELRKLLGRLDKHAGLQASSASSQVREAAAPLVPTPTVPPRRADIVRRFNEQARHSQNV
jgi:hypothetical protein